MLIPTRVPHRSGARLPSAFLSPPAPGRGRTGEPSWSPPSRRSVSRGSSAAPVAKATGSAARCGRLVARGRRCGPTAGSRRGGGTAGELGSNGQSLRNTPPGCRLLAVGEGLGGGGPPGRRLGPDLHPLSSAGAASPRAFLSCPARAWSALSAVHCFGGHCLACSKKFL